MKKLFFLILLVSFTFITSCTNKKPKYVFLFVGDGMGLSHTSLTEAYLASVDGKIGFNRLTFTKFPSIGITTTNAKNKLITDSAAAGTAIATGNKTKTKRISKDISNKIVFKSIGESLRDLGYKVGILTNVSIVDATPSVFFGHEKTRHNKHNLQMALAKSGFNFFAGAYTPAIKNNSDPKNELVKNKIKILTKKEDFSKLEKEDKAIAICQKTYLNCYTNKNRCNYDCLSDMDLNKNDMKLPFLTKKAIKHLYNDKGFFMMIEEGKLDKVAHKNDTKAVITSVINLDNSIKEALKFYKKHPNETLIVVCADHETGGISLGRGENFTSTHFEILKHQKVSVERFEQILIDYVLNNNRGFIGLMPLLNKYFGLGNKIKLSSSDINRLKKAYIDSEKIIKAQVGKTIKTQPTPESIVPNYVSKYGFAGKPISYEIVHILSEKASVGWTTYDHTAQPTIVYAKGVGAEKFNGYYDNTNIFKKLKELLNF
jgi:alkaline phosphatase